MTFSMGKKAMLGLVLAASTLAAAPAQARDGYRGRDHGGDDAAIAIGAGVVGLALGAALASDRNDRYYDDYYYDDYYYGGPRAYSYGYPRGYYYGYDAYPRTYRYNRGWNGYNRGYRGGYSGNWNRGYRGDWGRRGGWGGRGNWNHGGRGHYRGW